ncbi:MAG: T9SS type A sorting domain-containing protein, partial [Candidatus Cloacimonadaceae bacterium]|nr:T9SS type A sorting domain-containing protein [Candidatus Cloacimonadaceae bacterium]
PNPFSAIAVIRYELSRKADVNLKIYNLRGQLVRALETGYRDSGEHIVAWEGCDEHNRTLASGVYFLRFSVDGKLQKQSKLVLMK